MDDIRSAEVVLPGAPLTDTVAFFRELGFRLETIRPADGPREATLAGFGTRVRLDATLEAAASALHVVAPDPGRFDGRRAPNGTVVHAVAPLPADVAAPPCRGEAAVEAGGGAWHEGRAGMQYRDLLPGRMNGHLIASHIRIPTGGPVADDVHSHDVRYQLIHCVRGSVRLVYEDQGEPFELHAGACVLQPPGIRHRVLACSPGVEVVELACPAEHTTRLDHYLRLPTAHVDAERDFGGQRFHVSARGEQPAATDDRIDLGVAAPSGGLVDAVRLRGAAIATAGEPDERLTFTFVVAGTCRVTLADTEPRDLTAGAAVTTPPGTRCTFAAVAPTTELLQIRLRTA